MGACGEIIQWKIGEEDNNKRRIVAFGDCMSPNLITKLYFSPDKDSPAVNLRHWLLLLWRDLCWESRITWVKHITKVKWLDMAVQIDCVNIGKNNTLSLFR